MKVIIVGGGKVGAYIVNLLLKNKCSAQLIEINEAVYEKLITELPREAVVLGDGTSPTVLETAGIGSADVVVAVTGADETNLVISTIAKFEFSLPRVIARVNNPKNEWLFSANMGVDVALNQADLMAHLVVEDMDLKNMYTLLKISHGNFSIVEIHVDAGSAAENKPVRELDVPEKSVLISLTRGDEVIIPRGDTVIHSGDVILALTDAASKSPVNALFKARG